MEKRGFLYDYRVHILCIVIVIIAELIGPIKVGPIGPISFSLLPMLFALIIGMAIARLTHGKFITDQDMDLASQYVGITVMYLIAYMSSTIGPDLDTVLAAGPALILQEFGNLATVLFAMPVALFVFKMDRTAIGSSFSISREGSLGIVGSVYGLDSPEGRGVMGSYITGTILGTIFCGILASLMLNITWFSAESLAMAAGTGSSSMMSAAIAPIVEAFPERADELMSYAASSQVLSSVDGTYMSLFLALPLCEWIYKKVKGKEYYEKEKAKLDSQRKQVDLDSEESSNSTGLFTKLLGILRILIISGIIAMVAIWINGQRSGNPAGIFDSLPGLLWLLAIIIISILIDELLQKANINLPTILYIATLSAICSIPGLWPGAGAFNAAMANLSLLPLCTPILAYAGISTAKDIDTFLKQGPSIVVVTLCALTGTYVGSAVISNIVLKITGVI